MLLSNCDVCGKIFDEDHEEMTFCNHCSQYKCSNCSKKHHNNLTELLYIYQINRKITKLCYTLHEQI